MEAVHHQADDDFFAIKAAHPQPEIRLWIEVLKLAVEDLDKPPGVENSAWWFRSQSTEPGSFLWIREALGISTNHPRVRRRLSGFFS